MLLATAAPLHAQGVLGMAADSTTNEPLHCVDVALADSTDHALAWSSTGADGTFRFDSSPVGAHHLRFNVWHHVPIIAPLPTSAPAEGALTRYRLAFELGERQKPKYWPDTTDSPPGRPLKLPPDALRYPPELRKQHIEGGVLTRYVLDARGYVDSASIRILQSDDPAFTASVDTFLRQVQLTPAYRAGKPVCALILVAPYHFNVQGG
jgi:TonB family protein